MKTKSRTQTPRTVVEPKTTVLPRQRGIQPGQKREPVRHRGAIATAIVSLVAAGAGVVMLWTGVFDSETAAPPNPGIAPSSVSGSDTHLYNEAARIMGERRALAEELSYGSDRHLYNMSNDFAARQQEQARGSDVHLLNQADQLRAEQQYIRELANGSDKHLYYFGPREMTTPAQPGLSQLTPQERGDLRHLPR